MNYDSEKFKYYINPKERQLSRLYLYCERITGEVAVLNSFRYRRITRQPKLDEGLKTQIEAYDKKLRSAIDQGDKLIDSLTALIQELEHTV